MITNEIIAGSDIHMSEYKSRFMDSLLGNDNARYNFTLFFKLIRKYEDCFDKDILFFTRSQLIAMFEDLDSTPSSFEQRYGYLNKYYEVNAQVVPKISFDNLDNSESIRRNSIRDFYEFLYIINYAFNPDDMHTLDVMRKTCVILLYLGVAKSEITSIRKDDYDEKNCRLRIKRWNMEFKNIDVQLGKVLETCKEMTTYNSTNPKYANCSVKGLQSNDYLIRGDSSRRNDEQCPSFFIDRIFAPETFEVVNKSLTPTRVIEAGLYHQLYQLEKGGEPFQLPYFRELLSLYFNKPISKYQHYLQNYISWKKAFDLQ